MSEVLKVIVKRVGEDPVVEEVENRLGALQDLVGGYLEAVTIATDMCALVDEEGLLKGRKYNCDVCNYPLFGTIVLVGVDGENFVDCPISVEWTERLGLFRRKR